MLAKDKKILIVDDSAIIRKSLTNFLSDLGYENIVYGENGKKAVEVYAAEKPDLIIMDVVMPEMTGDEALEQIRAEDKETPVVMITSVADDKVMDKCKALGIRDYMLKPLTKENGPKLLVDMLFGL